MTREELESLDEGKVKCALQKVFASKGFKVFIGSKSLRFEDDNDSLCWKAESFHETRRWTCASDWKCYNLAFDKNGMLAYAYANSNDSASWKSLALKIEEHFGEVVLVEDWIHAIKPLQMPKTVEEILIEGDLL